MEDIIITLRKPIPSDLGTQIAASPPAVQNLIRNLYVRQIVDSDIFATLLDEGWEADY